MKNYEVKSKLLKFYYNVSQFLFLMLEILIYLRIISLISNGYDDIIQIHVTHINNFCSKHIKIFCNYDLVN